MDMSHTLMAGDTIYTCGLAWLPNVPQQAGGPEEPRAQAQRTKAGKATVDTAQAKLEYERAGGYVLFTLVYNIAISPSGSAPHFILGG